MDRSDWLTLAIIGSVIGLGVAGAWQMADKAQVQGESRQLCLDHGYPEQTIANDQWYCIRRVKGVDQVVSVSALRGASHGTP